MQSVKGSTHLLALIEIKLLQFCSLQYQPATNFTTHSERSFCCCRCSTSSYHIENTYACTHTHTLWNYSQTMKFFVSARSCYVVSLNLLNSPVMGVPTKKMNRTSCAQAREGERETCVCVGGESKITFSVLISIT